MKKMILLIIVSVAFFGCDELPVVEFTAAPTTILLMDTVYFSDNSENGPTEWFWEFGDGMTSIEQKPAHVYVEAGVYSVKLTAKNNAGESFKEEIDYIKVENEIVDIDGNVYPLVRIGNQVWMAKNLATTKLNDGEEIITNIDSTEWFSLTTPGCAWYDNDPANKSSHGALYNYYAVETEKLCPSGWHAATDEDWMELEQFIGMSHAEATSQGDRGTQAAKLKSNTGWADNNGTDNFGLAVNPTGARTSLEHYNMEFVHSGTAFVGWAGRGTSTFYRVMASNGDYIQKGVTPKKEGLSVRCVKD